MKTLKEYWWLLLTFALVTGIFLFKNDDLEPLIWNMDNTSGLLGVVFTKLLIVGALMDQLIAVFFPQDDDDKALRAESLENLNIARENKKLFRREVLSRQFDHLNNDDRVGVLNRMENQIKTSNRIEEIAKGNIASIDIKRSAYVRKMAFAFGLILAISGITILSDFIDMSENNLNHKIISYVDILFTAAVLSGGTSGINQLLQIIKDSWKKS